MVCQPIDEKDRMYLGVKCKKEEMDSLRLIINKIHCASACLNPANIPAGCDRDKAGIFVEKAIEAKAMAMWLEEDWWAQVVKRYKLPKVCFIDFAKREFYTRKE